MKVLFIILLAAHLIYAVAVRRRQHGPVAMTRPRAFAVLNQTVLFALALLIAWHDTALTRGLLNPVYIGLGLLGGHLVFGVTLLIIYRSVEDTYTVLSDVRSLFSFLADHPYILTRFIFVGVSEEIIYRAAAQPILIDALRSATWFSPTTSAAIGIVLVAAVFSLVHKHFFENSLIVSLEFVAFALLLGALYYITHSLTLVILIHTLRDIEICFLEYVVKVEQLGDRQRAAEAIEETYMPRVRKRREREHNREGERTREPQLPGGLA